MVNAKGIVSLVILLLLDSGCTSGAADLTHPALAPHQGVSFPARLRSPAPRLDCPLGPIRASKVNPSKLAGLMKGHTPTWAPPGFGLVEAVTYLGFGSHTSGGGAIWVDENCRSIEASAYSAPNVSLGWSTEGSTSGCSNAVLGRASCWTIQAPGTGQIITVQTMGVPVRQTTHIARSMHPSSSGKGSLCPAKLKREQPQPSTVAGSDQKLVPGKPVAIELCSYRGLSNDPVRSLRLRRASSDSNHEQVQGLIAILNGLKRVPPTSVFSCPNDSGAADLLRFVYGAGGHLDIIIPTSGCRLANNGTSAWFTTPAVWHFIDQIGGGHH
jgi:hypothetical protein